MPLTFKRFVSPAQLGVGLRDPVTEFVFGPVRTLLDKESLLDPYAHRALGAFEGDTCVAAFAYSMRHYDFREGRTHVDTLYAEGTVVHKKYRREGLGTELWVRTLKYHRAREISVTITNPFALQMLRNVHRRLPNVAVRVSLDERVADTFLGAQWCRDFPSYCLGHAKVL